MDGNFGKSMYNNIRHSNDKGKFQGKNNRGDHNRKNSSERRQSGGYNQNQHTHQYEQYQLSFLPEFPPPEHGVMLANYKEAPPGWGPWMEELHFPIGQGPYPYDQPPMYSWPGQPNDSYNLGNYHNHSLNDCGYLENPEFVPPIVYPSIPGPEISRESQHYNAPIYPINNGGYALLQAAANEAAQVKVSETSGKASSYNDSSRSRNRFLPDDRRFTLRCTGIPSYVSKEDIMKHFEAFGSIVELHYNLTKRDDTENKKAYNECLVQFYHLENAKKCYNSPLPVLNNRFIKLFQANTNLINIAEVTASSEIIAKDKALLAETVHQLQHTNKHQTEAPSDKVSKNERSYTDDGPPGKYMRVDGGGVTNDGNRRATELPSADGVNILKSPEEFKEIPVPPKPTEEDLEMKRQFEDLKELRNKADKILKDKEAILQVSIFIYSV